MKQSELKQWLAEAYRRGQQSGRAEVVRTLRVAAPLNGHLDSVINSDILKASGHSVRSPKGGIALRGKWFPGGQFIYASVLAQLTPAERNHLNARLETDASESGTKKEHVVDEHGNRIGGQELAHAKRSSSKAADLLRRVKDAVELAKLKEHIGDAVHRLSEDPKAQQSARDVEGSHDEIRALLNSGDPDRHKKIAGIIQGHTLAELRLLRARLGLEAPKGKKLEVIAAIAAHAAGMPEKQHEVHEVVRRLTVDEAEKRVSSIIASGKYRTPEGRKEIARMLQHQLRVQDIKELRNRLGISASGSKRVLAAKIAARAGQNSLEAMIPSPHSLTSPGMAASANSLTTETARQTWMPGASTQRPPEMAVASARQETKPSGEATPVKKVKTRKKPSYGEDNLVSLIISEGGINPNSHDLLTHYGSMKEAIEDGVPLNVFRKKGLMLDELAEGLSRQGFFSVPSNTSASQVLLDMLRNKARRRLVELTDKEYDRMLEERYRKEHEDALRIAAESEVDDAVRTGERDGQAEGAADPFGESSDNAGQDTGVDELAEQDERWDDEDVGDASFDPEEIERNAAAVTSEPRSEPQIGEIMEFPPTANGRRGFSLQLHHVDDNHAYLKYPGSDHTAVKIPRESLKQFRDDMMGVVDVPATSDITEINDVATGKAKLLGHGDDGMAFDAGDKIVKVSSVVPFHPTNSVGQRTPEQAIEQARKQFEAAKEMFQAGVPGIPHQSVRQIGDKVFTVREKLDIPEKFTAEQIDQVRRSMDAMHAAGFSLNDEIQVGIGKDGKVYHFDTGKAAKASHHDDIHDDSERFERFAEKHGHEALPLAAKAKKDIAAAEKNEAFYAKHPKGMPKSVREYVDRARRGLAESERLAKPPEPEPTPETDAPQLHLDAHARAAADHRTALNAIAPGESAHVAGHFIRRGKDGSFQIETSRGYVAGTADEINGRIKQNWGVQRAEAGDVKRAMERVEKNPDPDPFFNPKAADAHAKGRAAVPHGTRGVSLDPNTHGRTGSVVRDPETGVAHLKLDNGMEEKATDFEPLDPQHSWREPLAKPEVAATPKPEAKPLFDSKPVRDIHPLDLTPENIGGEWERLKDQIAATDPKLSPNAAGEIAASRLLNTINAESNSYTTSLDEKVKRGEPITDEEDARYAGAHDVRRNVYDKLTQLSGYRPGAQAGADDHPLANPDTLLPSAAKTPKSAASDHYTSNGLPFRTGGQLADDMLTADHLPHIDRRLAELNESIPKTHASADAERDPFAAAERRQRAEELESLHGKLTAAKERLTPKAPLKPAWEGVRNNSTGPTSEDRQREEAALDHLERMQQWLVDKPDSMAAQDAVARAHARVTAARAEPEPVPPSTPRFDPWDFVESREAYEAGLKRPEKAEEAKAKEPHEMTRAEVESAMDEWNAGLDGNYTPEEVKQRGQEWRDLESRLREIESEEKAAMRQPKKADWHEDQYVEKLRSSGVDRKQLLSSLRRMGISAQKIKTDDGLMRAMYKAAKRNIDQKKTVESALAAGKPVPPEVLADYPDLAAKVEPIPQVDESFTLSPPLVDESTPAPSRPPLADRVLAHVTANPGVTPATLETKFGPRVHAELQAHAAAGTLERRGGQWHPATPKAASAPAKPKFNPHMTPEDWGDEPPEEPATVADVLHAAGAAMRPVGKETPEEREARIRALEAKYKDVANEKWDDEPEEEGAAEAVDVPANNVAMPAQAPHDALRANNNRIAELESQLEPTHEPYMTLQRELRELRAQPFSNARNASIRKKEAALKKLAAQRDAIEKEKSALHAENDGHVAAVRAAEPAPEAAKAKEHPNGSPGEIGDYLDASKYPTKEGYIQAEHARLRKILSDEDASDESLRAQAEMWANDRWTPPPEKGKYEVGQTVSVNGSTGSYRGTFEKDGKKYAVIADNRGQHSVPFEQVEHAGFKFPEVDAREPHQKTWNERRKDLLQGFMSGGRKQPTPNELRDMKKEHHDKVMLALAAGKPVPPEVLADYPDLAAKHGKPSEPAREAPRPSESASTLTGASAYRNAGDANTPNSRINSAIRDIAAMSRADATALLADIGMSPVPGENPSRTAIEAILNRRGGFMRARVLDRGERGKQAKQQLAAIEDEPLLSVDDLVPKSKPKDKPTAPVAPAPKSSIPQSVSPPRTDAAKAVADAYARADTASDAEHEAALAHIDTLSGDDLDAARDAVGLVVPKGTSQAKLRQMIRNRIMGRRGATLRNQALDRPNPTAITDIAPEHAPIVAAINAVGGPDELTVNSIEQIRRDLYSQFPGNSLTPGLVRDIAEKMRQSVDVSAGSQKKTDDSIGEWDDAPKPELAPVSSADTTEALPTVIDPHNANVVVETKNGKKQKLLTWPFHRELRNRLREGKITAAELKQHFEAMVADPAATKQHIRDVLKKTGMRSADRINEQADSIYDHALQTFNLGGMVSYHIPIGSPRAEWDKAKINAYRRVVEPITDEQIQGYAAGLTANRDAAKKALTNPETPDEFRHFLRHNTEENLTPEQAARWDEIQADERRERDAAERARNATVAGVHAGVGHEIHEGFHTKHQKPLHIVKLSGRVDNTTFKTLAESARKLGGNYQQNSKWTKGKSPDGFNFDTREQAERFAKLLGGESVSRLEDWDAARHESRQATADRLRGLAERTSAASQEALSRDRLTNTHRRAEMAASAEAWARKRQAFADTVNRIADAIADGKAKHLLGIRAGTHVEALDAALNQAKWAANRKWHAANPNASYAERQDRDGRPADASDIAHTPYPHPWFSPGDLMGLSAKMKDTPGAKRLGERVRKWAEQLKSNDKDGRDGGYIKNHSVLEELSDVARNPGAYGLDRHQGDMMRYKLNDYMRLQAADIKTTAELRAALREYLPLKQKPVGEDPIKAAERNLIGKPIAGFFPTPRPVIDDMLDRADIQPGMSVLEPSAGKGDILDAVKERHPDAQTFGIEHNSELVGINRLKGHNVQHRDFMDVPTSDFATGENRPDRIVMNPPFENGQDMDHVRRAYDLLKPGGKLVAIMSEGPFFREDKKASTFRDWLESIRAEHESMPEGSFAGNDAFRKTGVRTRMVTIEKPS